jgi:hypothetical protein
MRFRYHHSSLISVGLLWSFVAPAQTTPEQTVSPTGQPVTASGETAQTGAAAGAPAAEPSLAEPTDAASGSGAAQGPAAAEPTGVAPVPETTPTEAAPAQDLGAAGWGDLSTLETETSAPSVFQAKLYGFIDSYYEKVAKTPDSIDDQGKTVWAENPGEFDVLNFNVMVQGAVYEKYRFFINLASPGAGGNIDDEPVSVRNAWVEAPLVAGYLNIRAGKTYRRFGLYNEIMDAVPTFIGIETPEIFDKDHLMLTRTTNLMLHGSVEVGSPVLNYSLTTGNDEAGKGAIPIGGDLNLDMPIGLKLGTSFYVSGGKATPSRAVGEGSPRGGVANWMAEDEYYVVGGYGQIKRSGFILQGEYWFADHDATRDSDSLQLLADDGSLNPYQMRRFFEGGNPDNGFITKTKYQVHTFYVRTGYEIALGDLSSITPYAQVDFYKNPEIVRTKDLGGDDEAGLADNNRFFKYTVGFVGRPVPQVALKVDSSVHQTKFNGKTEIFPEIRASFSYLWELAQ